MSVRHLAVAVAVAAVASAGFVAPTASAKPAAAETIQVKGKCGDKPQDVETSGAEAHWTFSCTSTSIYVTGWVKDTSSDGQCAEVYAFFPSTGNTLYSPKACPSGEVQNFNLADTGSSANVYLREVG
ncbi:hypothetical protein [Streptomyces sp. BE147]|uniref:hypothetical protein n=1 Tax=unclassified Streptomyces TaxID=2593676 RepID=UPI002E76E6CC|nr:hypothetical protein [Streptomyces sp. BE147]MEE1738715.1 hypothetical protein [Streptomyces sp. BE147]